MAKERAIRTKKSDEKKDVFYISLASCDELGKPNSVRCPFDIISKQEMQDNNVVMLDVHDLLKYDDGQPGYALDLTGTTDKDIPIGSAGSSLVLKAKSPLQELKGWASPDEDAIQTIVKASYDNLMDGKITIDEFLETMENNGVSPDNALSYYLKKRACPVLEHSKKNVYDILLEFVKRNSSAHIFVDEFPFLLNGKGI